jgi:hypothetical protein
MKQTLIKISETHYIIVDDSEIRESDYHVATRIIKSNGVNAIGYTDKEQLEAIAEIGGAKKITHSTEPLDKDIHGFGYCWTKDIIPLPLSQVEEAINGYSVEKMAYDVAFRFIGTDFEQVEYLQSLIVDMFNAHKELVKDKLFTIEDMRKAIEIAQTSTYVSTQHFSGHSSVKHNFKPDEIIQSLLPKTEWEVTFNEQGKLKLI